MSAGDRPSTGARAWHRLPTGAKLPTCVECGHSEAAHNFYSRCLGTLNQPDCRCLRTPSEVGVPDA